MGGEKIADGTLLFKTKLDTNGLQTGLKSIDDKLRGIQKSAIVGLGAIGSGFLAAGFAGAKFNSEIETYQTSFEVMTGSAEKAKDVVSQLKKIGAETPFELSDLAQTTQLLMNYGFTADEAIDRMQMLGDISQGNAEKMNRISTAYGQMSSAGKVNLEDIKQMIEAGFNPLQEISESTGESMESLYDRISKGTISVDEITSSMQRSTSEGGKYYQSMEKQSKTLNGMLSTLSDTVKGKLGEAFSFVNDGIKEILPNIISFIENLDVEKVIKGLTILVGVLGAVLVSSTALRGVMKLFDFITLINNLGGLNAMLGAFKANLITVASTVAPIIGIALLVVGVIAAVAVALNQLWKENDAFKTSVMNAWKGIKDTLLKVWNSVLKPIFENLKKVFSDIWENGVKPFWESFKGFIEDIVIGFTTLWNSLKPFVDWFIMTLGPIFADVFNYCATNIGAFITFAINNFGGFLTMIGSVFNGVVGIITGVIDFITGVFTGDWDKAWQGIVGIFSGIWNTLSGIVSGVWNTILGLFSLGGQIFSGVVDGIANVFKTIVNTLITGINNVISKPFDLMNGILNGIRNFEILGSKPFKGLWGKNPIPVPQIPMMERGGILRKGQVGFLEGNGSEAVVPLDRNKHWIKATTKEMIKYMPQMVSQTKEQVVNFYQPVKTPDEMARALRMQQKYGLAGA